MKQEIGLLHGESEVGREAGESKNREIPQVGQGVEIDARDEVFVVLRTDLERGTVDVLQMSGVRQIQGGVPLNTVRIKKEQEPLSALTIHAD
jgi:hypothetical protein